MAVVVAAPNPRCVAVVVAAPTPRCVAVVMLQPTTLLVRTVDALKARTKRILYLKRLLSFQDKSSRDFQKIPSFFVFSLCDYHCTLAPPVDASKLGAE